MNEEKGEYLNLQFNEAIIQRTKEANIQMDLMGSVMFVLFGLFEGKVKLLDCADDSNRQRRMFVLYRQLELRGFLEKDPDKKAIYRLTPKGLEFVTFLKEQFSKEFKEVHTESFNEVAFPIIVDKEDDPIGGWIAEYVNLFPSGNVEGRRFKIHPKALISKMRAFINQYNFDKETILQATKMYLAEQAMSMEGHKYTRTASYFIAKDRGSNYTSDLATWCQRVVDGDFDDPGEQFDTKIMDMV